MITAEARRILDAAQEARLTLRLVGSLAVLERCPRYGPLAAQGRVYRDIDFAGYARQARDIQALMSRLGYVEDREVFVLSEGGRAIFENPASGLHVDLFFERLDFCHVIRLNGRLEADAPTLPLAELLLGKMQIVKVNEKDILDAIALLLEHELGESDADRLNVGRIAKLCAEDWGLWRTTTMNLEKVRHLAEGHLGLEPEQRARLTAQIDAIVKRIEAEPKPLAWRMRARIGDRVKWYKDVEEVR
jgi:hypothetical protein